MCLDDYLDSVKNPDGFGHRRVAIACGSPNTSRKYARMCLIKKIPCKVYISDASHSVNNDFLDPDGAWKNIGVIIFTSKLSVAVDPRTTTFGHLIIDTSRAGCNLRDMFQGIDRFGRLKTLLCNPVIICLIHDPYPASQDLKLLCDSMSVVPTDINECIPQYDALTVTNIKPLLRKFTRGQLCFVRDYETSGKNRISLLDKIKCKLTPVSVPTLQDKLKEVKAVNRSRISELQLDAMKHVKSIQRYREVPEWIVPTMAVTRLERARTTTQRLHTKQLPHLAEKRGYAVSIFNDDAITRKANHHANLMTAKAAGNQSKNNLEQANASGVEKRIAEASIELLHVTNEIRLAKYFLATTDAVVHCGLKDWPSLKPEAPAVVWNDEEAYLAVVQECELKGSVEGFFDNCWGAHDSAKDNSTYTESREVTSQRLLQIE